MIHRRPCARLPLETRLRRPVPILLLLASLATVAVAQPTNVESHPEKPAPLQEIRPLVFGASVTPGFGAHIARFSVKAGTDECGAYTSGSGFVLPFDVFALWNQSWLDGSWLTARVGYRRLDVRLVSNSTPRPFFNATESRPDTVIAVTRFDVERAGVDIGIGAAYAPIPRLLLGLSPTLTIAGLANGTHTDSIVAPREARYEGSGWTRPFGDGTVVEFNRVVVGVELSATAIVPMGDRLAAYPGVRAQVSLTSHSSSVPWRQWSIGASLGIGLDVSPRARDTVPIVAAEIPPVRRPYLRATITARGIDENGREYPDPVIEIEETPWVEVVPLLPYVFFDSASSVLASRYAKLKSAEEVRRFSVDSLLDIDPIDMHWQVLNVIGSRLRGNPAITGTITGTSASDEAAAGPGMRMLRALAVREYLVNVWGIERDRLHVATSPTPMSPTSEETREGRDENRRVEMAFSDPELLDHVTVRRTASIASPPAVKFYPEIVADSAIVEWKISAVQGEKELLRFEGSGEEQSLKQNKLWSLADLRINRDLSEIRYRIDVRDVTGQTTSADGRFRVVERMRRGGDDELEAMPTIVEHFLVGFPYNTAELLVQHRHRLEEIASTITPDDEVLLVGYTDRIGAQERNRQLSLERAQVVHDALRTSKYRELLPEESAITVRGFGPQEELFDNALPEGRMFSRMVRIVITSYRDD